MGSIQALGGKDQLKQLEDMLKNNNNKMPDDIKEKISELLSLLKGGIEHREIGALISLLEQIGGSLPSDILNEIIHELKNMKKDFIHNKLEKKGIDVDKIPEKIIEALMEKITMDMLEKMA